MVVVFYERGLRVLRGYMVTKVAKVFRVTKGVKGFRLSLTAR